MKKIILLFVTFCTISVFSQKSKLDEGIKLGIKGGLNVSNLMGDVDDLDLGIRTSVHIGMLAEIIVSDKFSIQPELLYSGQGTTVGSVPGFSRYKLNYITLPVLAKFPVLKGLYLETGPQVGFLISAKNKTNDSNDKIKGIKTLDFGLNAGLNYEFKNGVFIQGRYNLGLTDTGATGDDNKRASNSVIQFSLGCLF
ncbi:MAG: porin family protein [Flavobacterium sp.]|uniref:porin family protein n=1 Tax=Flavobacterium sp. TaxID=239 RepID=UPI003BC9C873